MAATGLAFEHAGQVVRQADGCALHTRILAYPSAEGGEAVEAAQLQPLQHEPLDASRLQRGDLLAYVLARPISKARHQRAAYRRAWSAFAIQQRIEMCVELAELLRGAERGVPLVGEAR